MDHQREKRRLRIRRAYRVGKKIKGTAEQPRLSIRRSLQHIYCQVIDDEAGRTLVSVNTRQKELRDQLKYGGNRDAAAAVGKLVAQRAQAAGIQALCVDRGSCKYHGRVAALTQAVREGGIHV